MIDLELTRGNIAVRVNSWEECSELINAVKEAEPGRNRPWDNSYNEKWYNDNAPICLHTNMGGAGCMTYARASFFENDWSWTVIPFEQIVILDDFEFDPNVTLSVLFGL